MDVAGDDRYLCNQILGFFVTQNERTVSPQFSVFCNTNQNGYVVITPLGEEDVGARLVLVHYGLKRKRGKIIGFTAEKNEKLGYFFTGRLPFGKLLLIPVDGRMQRNPRPNYPYEDYVTLLDEADGCLKYTRRAEEAVEYLFELLDADNNGFVSASEMSILKEFLGLGHGVTDEEWSDALFGWQDGDLDASLTEMSCEFFKSFVLRLCDEDFTFSTGSPVLTFPYSSSKRGRRTKYLERIFACFGFDKDLVPNASRYSIRIYTERNSFLKFVLHAKEKVPTEKAILSATRILGDKSENRKRNLTAYVLKCCDWFSALVKNDSDEAREVMIDCNGSPALTSIQPTPNDLKWRKVIPQHGEMLVISKYRETSHGIYVFCERQNHPGPELHLLTLTPVSSTSKS